MSIAIPDHGLAGVYKLAVLSNQNLIKLIGLSWKLGRAG